MAFRYTDALIPKKTVRSGSGSRSSSDAAVPGSRSSSDAAVPGSRSSSDAAVPGSRSFSDVAVPGRERPGTGRNDTDIAGRSGSGSRWTMITQEELFSVPRPGRDLIDDSKAAGPFAQLLKMTKDYQITDQGRAEAFLKQARIMESYVEDGPVQCTDEYHAFVGYQEMSPRELHGYFAWRTKLLRDERVPLSFSFLLLHAAELINLIGARDEQDAFDKLLKRMQIAYDDADNGRKGAGKRQGLSRQVLRRIPARMADTYEALAYAARSSLSQAEKDRLERILQDFVISWGPEPEIVQEYCIPNLEREWDNVTLSHLSGSDDASIYRLIRHLTEHRTLNSAFREEAGEDAWRVTSRVVRRVCLESEQEGSKPGLARRLLGGRKEVVRELFPWIPFQPRVKDGYHVEISPVTSYTYRDGKWFRSAYPSMRSEEALRELNEIVRECERVLRRKMRFRSQLPDRLHDPRLVKLIEEEYDRWIREKELRSRPEIHVDLSRLGLIREQAARTRDRLLEGTEEGARFEALNAAVEEGLESGMPDASVKESVEPGMPNASVEEDVESGMLDAVFGEGMRAVTLNTAIKESLESEIHETRQSAAILTEDTLPETNLPEGGLSEESMPGKNLPAENQPVPDSADGFFLPEERAFLRMLLSGENGKAYFRTHKILPSVFVDAINEKAYDEIGDSIVEEDGAGWRLVEDYREDVEDLLGETGFS